MRMVFVCKYSIQNGVFKTASWIQSILESLDSANSVVLVDSLPSCNTAVRQQIKLGTNAAQCRRLKNFKNEFSELLNTASPDIIVIFGAEADNSYPALCICKKEGYADKTVVFAQGFCTVCANHYAEGVPEHIINRFTFRDILRRDRIKDQIRKFQKRAETEQRVLGEIKHFIGRTTMDKALLRCFNKTANYYKCNDVLREPFYKDEWRFEDCQKHRIFVSQYYYPLKGFHFLIEAASLIVKKYPDMIIAAAGYNPIKKDVSHNELKDSSYIRYLKDTIRKKHLEKNVLFLGELNQEEMKKQYLSANAFVMPSTIENSPNSLAEAMVLGVPSVVSDVGGVADFAKHKDEAYIYPATDIYLLAHYISSVFDNAESAIEMGKRARERALREFDKETNLNRFVEICKKVHEGYN